MAATVDGLKQAGASIQALGPVFKVLNEGDDKQKIMSTMAGVLGYLNANAETLKKALVIRPLEVADKEGLGAQKIGCHPISAFLIPVCDIKDKTIEFGYDASKEEFFIRVKSDETALWRELKLYKKDLQYDSSNEVKKRNSPAALARIFTAIINRTADFIREQELK